MSKDTAISHINDLESNEDLARVTGEALQLIAKRGRPAWEELFQMLDSIDEAERGEIQEFLREYVEGEESEDLINQSDADEG